MFTAENSRIKTIETKFKHEIQHLKCIIDDAINDGSYSIHIKKSESTGSFYEYLKTVSYSIRIENGSTKFIKNGELLEYLIALGYELVINDGMEDRLYLKNQPLTIDTISIYW